MNKLVRPEFWYLLFWLAVFVAARIWLVQPIVNAIRDLKS